MIKLIRYDLLTPTLQIRLKEYFFGKSDQYTRKFKRFSEAMNSYFSSYAKLSCFTNVMYAHLVKTDHLNQTLVLKDRLNRVYHLDLDSTGFVLQKKVKLLGDVLVDLKEQNKNQKIQDVLLDYLMVLKQRSDMGYWIKDHNQFLRNYGMVDGKVYEIDVGSYRDGANKDIQFFQKNNLDHLKRLYTWLEKKMPEHIAFLIRK